MLEEQSKNILRQQEAGEKLIKHWKQEAYVMDPQVSFQLSLPLSLFIR